MAQPMNARVSAGVVVEKGKGLKREILMVVRTDGMLGFPAGEIKGAETPVQCATRECLEEIGYEVVIDGLIKIITLEPEEGSEGPSIGFLFHGTLGKKVTEGEHQIKWFSLTQLLVFEKTHLFRPQFHMPALLELIAGWMVPLTVFFSKPIARF
jgi:8-oxo-dGTP pyrophosphatase MutT (NUDIX family)